MFRLSNLPVDFCRGCIALAILCLASWGSASPNFIVIFCDDLGYGDISCNGNSLIKTPHIDRLAEGGLNMSAFYASANVCTPSRAGLLTGRYSIRMGLAKSVIFPKNTHGIPHEEVTIAQALKDLDYATACVGKWHVGHTEEYWPTQKGFDKYYGLPYSNDMNPLALYRQSENIEEPVDQTTLTKRYTEESIKFIRENSEAPFFLYLAHSMPHIPLFVSEPFEKHSQAGLYGDVIEELDWSVGQLVKTLDELDLADDTLIVFTSDNGPWYEGSSGTRRNRKGGEAWDGAQCVPGIFHWPAKIPAGTTSSEPFSHLDLFPTLFALAGGEGTPGLPLDGFDLTPVLTAPNKAVPAPLKTRPIYLFDDENISAVRSGDWKLVTRARYRSHFANMNRNRYYAPGLLFNLKSDPHESYSFARDNPKVLDRMVDLLEAGEKDLKK